jgi:hypothetical protein
MGEWMDSVMSQNGRKVLVTDRTKFRGIPYLAGSQKHFREHPTSGLKA